MSSASEPRAAKKPKLSQLKPKGFRLGCVARESHGNVLYSVAWSTDVFLDDKGDVDSCKHKVGVDEETENHSAKHETQSSSPRRVRYVATCGGNHVSLYEVEVLDDAKGKRSMRDPLVLRQAYVDRDSDESFNSCVFGGRTLGRPFGYTPVMTGDKVLFGSQANKVVKPKRTGTCYDSDETETEESTIGETESIAANSNGEANNEEADSTASFQHRLIHSMVDTQKFDGPQLLCVAGSRGVIKVIDTVQQTLFMTLSGHGHDIFDLKFSPVDEWLLLSASKDESVRLWNVMTGAMVAIFSGHEGHRNSVLSVAWHPLGQRFASAGMDNSVKIWSICEETGVHKSLNASKVFKAQKWDTPLAARPTPEFFRTAYEQTPIFSTNKLHHHYVDCVQFVGDLVLSKSIANTVLLWKPDFSRTITRRGHIMPPHHKPPNEVRVLREFTTKECDVWFIRFGTDVDCRMLALGNSVGEIRVWHIDANPKRPCFANLTHHFACSTTVRMVAFSPDAQCMIAACEDASLSMWDAEY